MQEHVTKPSKDKTDAEMMTGIDEWMNENVYVSEDVPLVVFMYLVFTRISGESYRRRLSSLLLHLCDVFRALINSLVFFFFYTVHKNFHTKRYVFTARDTHSAHM